MNAQISDNSPPETNVTQSPGANPAGWTNRPTVVRLEAEDDHAVFLISYALEGATSQFSVSSLLNPVTLSLDEGRWRLSFQARDPYGNEETEKSVEILVDSTAPTSTASVAGTAGNQGWHVSAVELSISANDPELGDGTGGSGIDRIEFSLDDGLTWFEYEEPIMISEEGVTRVLHRSIDVAGNEEEANEIVVRIDTIAPTLKLLVEPEQLWPPNRKVVPVQLAGEATDETSGLALLIIEVEDEYGEWEPAFEPVVLDRLQAYQFGQEIQLIAFRRGQDRDGRTYMIRVIVHDLAGNAKEEEVEVVVPHDQRERRE